MNSQFIHSDTERVLKRLAGHSIIDRGRWQLIAQGTSNQILRASIDSEHYVLRINANIDLVFGVDRMREALLLEVIGTQAWAVNVIENNVNQSYCLMKDHGEGACVSQKQLFDFMVHLQLFSHSLAAQVKEALVFDYSALMQQYLAFFQRTGGAVLQGLKDKRGSAAADMSLAHDSAMALCRLIPLSFHSLPSIEYCLVHQDLHSLNICQEPAGRAGQIKVIDWEYGGWGNPWLDIAALHNNFSLKQELLHKLPLTQGLTSAEMAKGLTVASYINRALECIWYWYRQLKSYQLALACKEEVQDNHLVDEIAAQQLSEKIIDTKHLLENALV